MFANAFTFFRTDEDGNRLRKPYVRLGVQNLTDSYGIVNLRLFRRALDTLTLEDETATVKVQMSNTLGNFWGEALRDESGRAIRNDPTDPWSGIKRRDWFELSLTDDGRVRVNAPCGQNRYYQLKTLDRALLAFGC